MAGEDIRTYFSKQQAARPAPSIMSSTSKKDAKRPASSPPEDSKEPPAARPKTTQNEPPPEASAPGDAQPTTLKLTYHEGDIFGAPDNTVLIHACNTQGSWGAGIAAAFRTKYPQAYKAYRNHCLAQHDPKTDPVRTGTCLLIPPCETNPKTAKHWIGCLFTSAKYGKAKDKPAVILRNTAPAMRDLMRQVSEAREQDEDQPVESFRMCKINSARFGVPWERTEEVLQGIAVEEGWPESIQVWSIE
ncbi:hypothetical protein BU26DRAFT_519424 [Trematosphaeria pertusa]|uniref:ADP-ribose 1''-phosphate phosphatase n=1 Tax=Trematosphaeria pertusa TaxID=390896 RepID=A0A6A6IFX6_9PLEO|nr:uncharacterized protein BU26DRAFT_519424 [Trematosphaeria pertusa]KAF2249306.1 hypothetical protein BU26DRAFT_519424 [Trematosphaeria pertusa]